MKLYRIKNSTLLALGLWAAVIGSIYYLGQLALAIYQQVCKTLFVFVDAEAADVRDACCMDVNHWTPRTEEPMIYDL